MESLFSKKLIDVICCTSTLLEGVNLPAKNIVIYKPKRGRSSPMNSIYFWNLAGRAGRLTKDFYGNIYCIDIDEWGDSYKPGQDQEHQNIKSSMEEVITQKRELIIQYLKQQNNLKKEDRDVEAAVTRFIVNEIRHDNIEFIQELIQRNKDISENDFVEIKNLVTAIKSEISLNKKVILNNSTIDPRLQNNLYENMKNMKNLPILNSPSSYNFWTKLSTILDILNIYLNKNRTPSQMFLIKKISYDWVNEKLLGDIINEDISYQRDHMGKNVTDKFVNERIEHIFETIEDVLRYEISKDLCCYIDILKEINNSKNLDININDNICYYFEMGAFKPTTITLIENGIPRTPAILISNKMNIDTTDFEVCKKYIVEHSNELKKYIPSLLFDDMVIKK